MPGNRLRVLLLCDDAPTHADTVLDHIGALSTASRHDVRRFNPYRLRDSRCLDLEAFDAVVLHYTIYAISDDHLAPPLREKLAAYRGPKLQFVQDEYRRVDELSAMVRRLGVGTLFTVVPEHAMRQVWRPDAVPGLRLVPTLTGYVPERLVGLRAAPLRERPLDVAYRGRELPWWLGRLARDKVLIGERFAAAAPGLGLRVDISSREEDRVYGARWMALLASARATLAVESGASVVDFDGSAERDVRAYLAAHPDATFEETWEATLAARDGAVVINAISPRVFEAAALRTALVVFPGEYSGVLAPDRHCITLEKDFSNLAAVADRLRDVRFLEDLTERAHAELVASGRWSYGALTRQYDAILDEVAHAGPRRPLLRFHAARFERQLPLVGVEAPHNPVLVAARRRMSGRRALRPLERLLSDPEVYAAKGLAALREVTRRRALLTRWALDGRARAAVSLDVLLEDLLKLRLVEDLARGELVEGVTIEVALNGDAALLRTVRASPKPDVASLIDLAGRRRLVWDHSLLGDSVELRSGRTRLPVHVGPGGRHTFSALEALLREPSSAAR